MDSINVGHVTYIYTFNGWCYTIFLRKRESDTVIRIDSRSGGATYEVNTVDLKTKEVGEVSDILHAPLKPGVGASSNRIVVCGGFCRQQVADYCQVYSPLSDE